MSPLDQFEVRDLISLNAPILGNLSLSLTNIGLYLTLAGYLVFTLSLLATNQEKIVPNYSSICQESVYATVQNIVVNQINEKRYQGYFSFIYALFTFILINNLIGMVPYSFASTSHFILTFSLSFTVVLGATILGLNRHGLRFFSLFVPAGCPLGLLPLLVLIEFISYLARNVSLGLRLAANILSGRMLLNILSGFTYNIMTSGFIFFFLGLLSLAFIIAFSGLELGIAFIQAQVFVVLLSSLFPVMLYFSVLFVEARLIELITFIVEWLKEFLNKTVILFKLYISFFSFVYSNVWYFRGLVHITLFFIPNLPFSGGLFVIVFLMYVMSILILVYVNCISSIPDKYPALHKIINYVLIPLLILCFLYLVCMCLANMFKLLGFILKMYNPGGGSNQPSSSSNPNPGPSSGGGGGNGGNPNNNGENLVLNWNPKKRAARRSRSVIDQEKQDKERRRVQKEHEWREKEKQMEIEVRERQRRLAQKQIKREEEAIREQEKDQRLKFELDMARQRVAENAELNIGGETIAIPAELNIAADTAIAALKLKDLEEQRKKEKSEKKG